MSGNPTYLALTHAALGPNHTLAHTMPTKLRCFGQSLNRTKSYEFGLSLAENCNY
jgi:hypothetical protein